MVDQSAELNISEIVEGGSTMDLGLFGQCAVQMLKHGQTINENGSAEPGEGGKLAAKVCLRHCP